MVQPSAPAQQKLESPKPPNPARQGPPKSPGLQVTPKLPRQAKPPTPAKPAGLSKSSALPKPQEKKEQPAFTLPESTPSLPESVPPIPRQRLESLKSAAKAIKGKIGYTDFFFLIV